MESTASSSLSSGSTANNHHLDPLAGNTDSENDTEHSSTVALVQLPAASPPDIIRATQKDTFYMYQLQTAIADIIGDIWGSRSQSKYTSEVRLASEALYYGLTMLSGAASVHLLLLQVLGTLHYGAGDPTSEKIRNRWKFTSNITINETNSGRLGKAITGPMASLHMASLLYFWDVLSSG
ncbi:hypothetical protein BASA83_008848 [Batrachochytrium salamandrivorans]|nr:hypothetical protein BASA83_008848 [Batrachochytrium salamandrivorans]